jgi:ADP-dependent NAD(P)H-hydrate dehydratase
MSAPKRVTRALLRRFPLPPLNADADKEDRGNTVVIAGSAQVPGASVLSGEATLRAAAGRVQIATDRAAVMHVALRLPEALVVPIPRDRGLRALQSIIKSAHAVLVGPGLREGASTVALARRVARSMSPDATLILDASAIGAAGAHDRCIITPHAGEMAALLGIDPDEVAANVLAAAQTAHDRFGGVVVMKAATTFIAADEGTFVFDGGHVGLATSGSGDVLSGVIAGLAARGASPLTASLWGVWVHAAAARRLVTRVGRTGFLASELLREVPAVLNHGSRVEG